MARVAFEHVTKRFGKVVAVDDLTLELQDREFLVILGPSGAGKTTTLRCVAGLEKPELGDIFIGAQRANDLEPAARQVAFVFQFYALYPHFTVYENMAFPLKKARMSKADMDRRINEAAKILHITDLLPRKPHQLSGGQQQRVALGRAMVRQPQLFLMDEPLTNLDATLRAEMRGEIRRLHNELAATTLYVTHDHVEAMSMGDRIAVLERGRIQQLDVPAEVYDHPANVFVASFLGSPSMNLVPAEFRNGDAGEVSFGQFVLHLSPEQRSKVLAKAAGTKLLLGVRPEDVTLSHEELSESFQLEVFSLEPLGSRQIIDMRMDDHLFKVKVPPTFEAKTGERLWVAVDRQRMHLFDAETSNAIF